MPAAEPIQFPLTTATATATATTNPSLALGLGQLDLVSSRISSSCSVPFPTLPAVCGIAAGLGATAASAAALASAWPGRATDDDADLSFLRLPALSPRKDGDGPSKPPPPRPRLLPRPATLIRSLLVPGLAEEVFWRVALTPHPSTVDPLAAATVPLGLVPILATNACFALYHLLGAELAARSGFHPNARKVFRHPAFLALAFCLGNGCSLAYVASGGAILAPVVVHGVAVAFWLDVLGGEEALRGGGDGGKGGDGCGGVGKDEGEEGVGRAVDGGEMEDEAR